MPNETDPLFLLYAVIVAQCGHLLFVLLRDKQGNRWWKYSLIVLTVSLTVMAAEFMLTWSGYLKELPWLMGVSYALPYLIGPAIVGCLHFKEGNEWRWSHAFHLLQFVVALGWSLPFLFLGEAVKSEIYETTIVTETYFREWPYIRNIVFKSLHLWAYAALSWYVFQAKDRVGKGLRLSLFTFALLLSTHAFLLAVGLPGYAITYSVLMAGFGGLALWLHYEFSRSVFGSDSALTSPSSLAPLTSSAPAAAPTKNHGESPKYEKSGLDERAITSGAVRLSALMETEAPYLDAGLRLRGLAEKSGLPEHHLSQILNVHFGQKFTDYVNGYRVAYARKLLRDGPAGDSVLTIAFAAGFNSKNSFNRAFRKFTGQSPTKYRKNGPIQLDGAGE